jgi:hypothetical protein
VAKELSQAARILGNLVGLMFRQREQSHACGFDLQREIAVRNIIVCKGVLDSLALDEAALENSGTNKVGRNIVGVLDC